jgi:hypothetical protein
MQDAAACQLAARVLWSTLRQNLAEGVGFELGHRSRQARALNKKDQASRLSSISGILLNHPFGGEMWAKYGHEVP